MHFYQKYQKISCQKTPGFIFFSLFFIRPHGDQVSVTPILGILVAIGSGLALVAVAIILVLKFRPTHSSYPNGGSQGGATHRRHKERTYLSAPHLPLDRQHREMPDECIDMEEKDPDIIPTNKGNFEKPNPISVIGKFFKSHKLSYSYT